MYGKLISFVVDSQKSEHRNTYSLVPPDQCITMTTIARIFGVPLKKSWGDHGARFYLKLCSSVS